MLLEYSRKKLIISLLIPVSIAICTALITVNFPMALVVNFLDIFAFWFIIVLVIGLATKFKRRPIEHRWEKIIFSTNIAMIFLGLNKILVPIIRYLRDYSSPKSYAWSDLGTHWGYNLLVILPPIIAIATYGLIIMSLAYCIKEIMEIILFKSVFMCFFAVILAYFLGKILAGLPLILI